MVLDEALKKLQEQIAGWPITQRFVVQQLIEDYLNIRKDLLAYKNTGLTPEQCENAKAIIESAYSGDTSKAERIRELLKADKDGRLVVLPCKVGDTVWRIKRTFEEYPDRSKPYIEPSGFLLQDVFNISKTVFLTRKEAEAAVEAMKDE